MNVAIATLPDFHVAYMRNVGPYGAPHIPALWTRLLDWAQPLGFVTPTRVTLGISYDNPRATPPEKCRYDACIVVPLDFSPEPKMNVREIPGGKYAVTEYVGTAADIIVAWNQLLSIWLPSSGYQMDNRDCFELYRGNSYVDKDAGIFKCDICVPVKAL
jgi:AraC family transcriptional regulator